MTSKTGLFKAAAKLAVSTAHIAEHVTKNPITWRETQDVFYPYETSVMLDKHPIKLKLRLNDFPEEVLYTVVLENPDKTIQEIVDANDFPENWTEENGSYKLD